MKKIILMIAIVVVVMGGLISFVNADAPRANSTGVPTANSTGNNVNAQDQTITKLTNPLNVDSVQDVIFLAVNIAMYVGVAFAILALIYVGFLFIMAQGNEDKLKEAKMWFMYIIVGLAILISSKVIVEIVKNTLSDAGVVDSSVFNRN